VGEVVKVTSQRHQPPPTLSILASTKVISEFWELEFTELVERLNSAIHLFEVELVHAPNTTVDAPLAFA
jgi:hypothetical protein